MLSHAEILSRSLRGDKDTIELKTQRLHGGISNINVRVESTDLHPNPVVLTFYPNNQTWYKVYKEFAVREIIGQSPKLPLQRILSSGVLESNGQTHAYVIKEYLNGDTLHNVLSQHNERGLTGENTSGLIRDLGEKIGFLHNFCLPDFGQIWVPDKQASWKDYYEKMMERRLDKVAQISEEKTAGKYKASEIHGLLPGLREVARRGYEALESIQSAHFTHNDLNFLNIVANQDGKEWKISGILDFEAAFAGDPEIDLVAIESQVFLSTYQDIFTAHAQDFREGYCQEREVSPDYLKKRLLYHLSRSLSYFEAIFSMDFSVIPESEINTFFADGHLKILRALANGDSLDDVGVLSLS